MRSLIDFIRWILIPTDSIAREYLVTHDELLFRELTTRSDALVALDALLWKKAKRRNTGQLIESLKNDPELSNIVHALGRLAEEMPTKKIFTRIRSYDLYPQLQHVLVDVLAQRKDFGLADLSSLVHSLSDPYPSTYGPTEKLCTLASAIIRQTSTLMLSQFIFHTPAEARFWDEAVAAFILKKTYSAEDLATLQKKSEKAGKMLRVITHATEQIKTATS